MQKTKDAFSQGKALIGAILERINETGKARQSFLMHIFMLLMGLNNRNTFENMGRYGKYCEQTYRNHYEKPFDFAAFNTELINQSCSGHKINVFDPSFIPKSGNATPGLGKFWHGSVQMAEKGLEIGGLAVVDVDNHTAMHLEAVQTPGTEELKSQGKSLVDHYAQLIIDRKEVLRTHSRYLCVDGYFSRKGFINPVCSQTNLEIIGKLRQDANLHYEYTGPKHAGRGRPRQYAEKVNTAYMDKRKIRYVDTISEHHLYSGVVYSRTLKRKVRIVQVTKDNGQYAILFSTDLELAPLLIYQYYKTRFQVEFLFRDAKQHTGLTHCQARNKNKLHFHFNASLTTVSLAKAIYWLSLPKEQRGPFSMGNIKTQNGNYLLAYRIFANLGLDLNDKKINHVFGEVLNYGIRAA